MLSQDTALDLLRRDINHLIDLMKAQQQRDAIQDSRLSEHDNRLSEIEGKLQEWGESIDGLFAKLRHFEYLVHRNEELEYRENPYSLDGEPNCDL